MPYLHILNHHGASNEVCETQRDTVEEAVRDYFELTSDGQPYYDNVVAVIYDKSVIGRTLLLRQHDSGYIEFEAILTNSPVRLNYVPREFISWEIRRWEDVAA